MTLGINPAFAAAHPGGHQVHIQCPLSHCVLRTSYISTQYFRSVHYLVHSHRFNLGGCVLLVPHRSWVSSLFKTKSPPTLQVWPFWFPLLFFPPQRTEPPPCSTFPCKKTKAICSRSAGCLLNNPHDFFCSHLSLRSDSFLSSIQTPPSSKLCNNRILAPVFSVDRVRSLFAFHGNNSTGPSFAAAFTCSLRQRNDSRNQPTQNVTKITIKKGRKAR